MPILPPPLQLARLLTRFPGRWAVAGLLVLSGVGSFGGGVSGARAAEFVEETERDFPLKTTGSLKILNQRGSISVVGWSMDRLRVKVKRKVEAANEAEAKLIFESLELAFRDHGADLELFIEGGRGMDLSTRLKERKSQRASVELEVRGPANLGLELWGVHSKMKVQNWNAGITARASSGEMTFRAISAGRAPVSAICADCTIDFKEVRANVRCVSEKGKIRLDSVTGNEVYAETVSGSIDFHEVRASQTYVSGSGAIDGRSSGGSVEFRSRGGAVQFSEVSGSVSGHTDTGPIRFGVTEWNPRNQISLDTDAANIELRLPFSFSSWVDFWAQDGRVDSEVEVRAVETRRRLKKAEPSVGERVRGMCGSPPGGERSAPFGREADIRVLSRRGNVVVRRSGDDAARAPGGSEGPVRDLLNHDNQGDKKSENSSD